MRNPGASDGGVAAFGAPGLPCVEEFVAPRAVEPQASVAPP